MSDYYSIPRKADWNYGGLRWKLSRSKIDLFQECARCFYLDNKLGLKRPPGYPFNLNTAVDTLLKTEFDLHRANGEQHPLQKQYGLKARPVGHESLDVWRANFEGVQYLHEPTGLPVSDTGYFVYCTGRPDAKAFDARIEFDVHLIAYTGSDAWVEGVLGKIKKTLDAKKIQAAGKDCDYCAYRHAIRELES